MTDGNEYSNTVPTLRHAGDQVVRVRVRKIADGSWREAEQEREISHLRVHETLRKFLLTD